MNEYFYHLTVTIHTLECCMKTSATANLTNNYYFYYLIILISYIMTTITVM